MTLGVCPKCNLHNCQWLAGPTCEGSERLKAFAAFAPAQRTQWPWGLRWIARKISTQLVELECENAYWRKVAKQEFDDIRLVDLHIKPNELRMMLRSGFGGILVSWMVQMMRSVGAKSYVEFAGVHPAEGELSFTLMRLSGEAPGQRAARYEDIIRSYVTPKPVNDWHEDMGACLFWTLDESGKPTEAPYSGTPNDIKPFHIVDGMVEVEENGQVVGHKESGGKIHTVESCPFPAYATHFTRIPEASLNWKPPDAPPVNTIKL